MKSGKRKTGQQKTSKSSSSENVGHYEPLASDDWETSGCLEGEDDGDKSGAQSCNTMDRGASNTKEFPTGIFHLQNPKSPEIARTIKK